jgi:putative FmdB family regulatory protein
MPVYEFRCRACGHAFSEFYRKMLTAEEQDPVACPACEGMNTVRTVARFAVHGASEADPGERAAEAARQQRMASITPKEQIDRWQKGEG